MCIRDRFNPATTIKFDIPAGNDGNTVLQIYDASGRNVETLLSGKLNAGSYEQIWNAEKYASGVYFIRLQSGNHLETKKMVLLK